LSVLFVALPWLPFVPLGVMAIVYRSAMGRSLNEDTRATQETRSFVLPMAGFSFAGLLATIFLDGRVGQDLAWVVYYLLVSFLLYLFAANLQSYKVKAWHDLVSDGLNYAAALGLVLGISSALLTTKAINAWALVSLASALWLVDWVIRLRITAQILKKEARNARPS